MITRLLGYLLHLANSSPTNRKRFYVMKDRVLRCGGVHDSHDIQHFEGKKCWSCHGTGTFYHTYSGDADMCWKCCGSGWYKREAWVSLRRTKLGRYTFHTPDGVCYERPDPMPSTKPPIEGFITHPFYSGFIVEEAEAWLALFFDWGYFKFLMGDHNWVRWPRFPGPMVQLMYVCGKIKYWKFNRDMLRDRDRRAYMSDEEVPF